MLAAASRPTRRSSSSEAERLARLCHRMAERFARGGRLVAFGALAGRALGRTACRGRVRAPGDRRQASAAGDRLDAPRAATSPPRCSCSHAPDDIAIAFGADEDGGEAARAIAAGPRPRMPDDRRSRRQGPSGSSSRRCATATCARSWSRRSTMCCGSSCTCSSSTAGCSRGASLAAATTPAPRASCIRSSSEREDNLANVLEDVRRSALMKSQEIGALRAQTLTDNAATLAGGRRARCAPRSNRAGRCWRSATAALRPMRWTSWRTSGPARGSGGDAGPGAHGRLPVPASRALRRTGGDGARGPCLAGDRPD